MLKKEIIWREILHQAFSKNNLKFTQKDLSEKLGFSISTVHTALIFPRQTAAIIVTGRNFRVADKEKFLLLWATHRQLAKDIIFKARVESQSVQELEGLMPPTVMFAAYSAYAREYHAAPADYDTAYVYLKEEDLSAMKKRFPSSRGEPNVIGLKSDPHLERYGYFPPLVQTFVDLWNLPQWYAKDFLDDVKKRLNA